MTCEICKLDIETQGHSPNCPYKGTEGQPMNPLAIFTTGWMCPKCKRIYAPIKGECEHCNKQIGKETHE